MTIKQGITTLLILCGMLLFFLLLQVGTYYVIGVRLARATTPFENVNERAEYSVLFTGDSTAYGTGASNPVFSTAGRFSVEHPHYSVHNSSVNGLRLDEFLEITKDIDTQYDLLVLQLGANDIIHLTPLEQIEADVESVLMRAQEIAHDVVWVTSGNIGAVEFFPWPISLWYEQRTYNAREIFLKKAQEYGIYYVDLFRTRTEIFARDDKIDLYAKDGLHLSDHGYGLWYKEIREVLIQNNLVFRKPF